MLSWLLCLEKKQECCIFYLWPTQCDSSLKGVNLASFVTWGINVVNLSFFKPRRGFYLQEIREIFEPKNLRVRSYILSEWLTEERIIKWQRPILTDGQFTRHKFVSESRNLYWQMTNKVKRSGHTQLNYIFTVDWQIPANVDWW